MFLSISETWTIQQLLLHVYTFLPEYAAYTAAPIHLIAIMPTKHCLLGQAAPVSSPTGTPCFNHCFFLSAQSFWRSDCDLPSCRWHSSKRASATSFRAGGTKQIRSAAFLVGKWTAKFRMSPCACCAITCPSLLEQVAFWSAATARSCMPPSEATDPWVFRDHATNGTGCTPYPGLPPHLKPTWRCSKAPLD